MVKKLSKEEFMELASKRKQTKEASPLTNQPQIEAYEYQKRANLWNFKRKGR